MRAFRMNGYFRGVKQKDAIEVKKDYYKLLFYERSKGWAFRFSDMKRHIHHSEPRITVHDIPCEFKFQNNQWISPDIRIPRPEHEAIINEIDEKMVALQEQKRLYLLEHFEEWRFMTLEEGLEWFKGHPNLDKEYKIDMDRLEKVKNQIRGLDKSCRDETKKSSPF